MIEHDDAPPSERTARRRHPLFAVYDAFKPDGAAKHMPTDCRFVLSTLANHASERDEAWPSLATIAAETNLGITTVRTCLADLEERGWIVDRGRRGVPGRQVRCFEVRSTGEPWEPNDARKRVPPKRTPSRDEPHTSAARTPPPDGTVPAAGRVSDPRAAVLTHAPGGKNPPNDPPMDPPNETPNVMRSHTRGEVQGDRPRPETAIPFGPSEDTAKASGEAQATFQLTPPGEDKPGKTRKRPARELPDDWQPNADALVLGRTLGFDAARVASEGAKMRDWARGDGKIKVDWHATFANWLRTASEREIARGIARKPIVPEPIRKSPGQPPRMVYPPKPPPPPPPEPTDPLDIYAPKGPWTEEEIRDIAERNAARIARVAAERAREAQGLPVE